MQDNARGARLVSEWMKLTNRERRRYCVMAALAEKAQVLG
jgi:hypothetical protein